VSTAALDREVNGLEFMQAIVAGEIANVPIGETLGFRPIEVEPGRIVFAGKPSAASLNLIGTTHGGWSAAILDTAMALAALTLLDARHDFTTLDLKLNFLRPVAVGTEVRCEGKVIHGGRRISLCEGRMVDGAGKLLVHGTSSCLIVPRGEKEKSQ
jgi:uncharacterized protein (TIGR00369 family)